MRRSFSAFAVGTFALLIIAACGSDQMGDPVVSSPVAGPAHENLNRAPLAFEENVGQTDSEVQFLARAKGYSVYFTSNQMVFDVNKRGDSPLADIPDVDSKRPKAPMADRPEKPRRDGFDLGESATLRVTLLDAKSDPKAVGSKKLPGVVNYFIGDDPSKWLVDVPNYQELRYKNVYKGIDLVVYGNQAVVEHDFIVDPKADYKQIRLGFDGASKLKILENGDLSATLSDEEDFIFKKPAIFQEVDGKKVKVEGSYVLNGDNEVGFDVQDYDSTLPLVIDPTALTYSSFLGGSLDDLTWGVATDATGNVYVAGYTKSANFPRTGGLSAPNNALRGTFDAYVTKISAAGNTNIYTTYLGGTGNDLANSIKVDTNGNAYIAGYTTSTNFPTAAAFQGANGGDYDAFLSKLNAAGTTLTYSTYLGGSGFEHGTQLALDTTSAGCTGGGARCVVLVGKTASSGLATAGVTQTTFAGGDSDGFVAKFNNAGARTLFTYLGGTARDFAMGVAVDGANPALVYVSGLTRSSDFPTTAGVIDTTLGGAQDAFVVKLNGTFTTKTYSTYLGGADVDGNAGIGLNAGSAYVVGATASSDFPTANAFDTTLGGTKDIYVAKLNTTAAALTYSTYIGGTGVEDAVGFQSIAVDGNGRAWVIGKTDSTVATHGFPATNAISGLAEYPSGATSSGFVAQILQSNSSASALRFATYLGGAGADIGVGIVVNSASTAAFVTGIAASSNFPTTSGVVDTTQNGGFDGYIAKITAPALISHVASTKGTVSGASVAVNVPAGTANGDVMVACVANRTNTVTAGTPSGWTLIGTLAQPAGNTGRISAFQRVASSEPASYNFTVSSPVSFAASISTFRNVSTSTPVDTSGSAVTASGTVHAAPSVTTTAAEDMVVACTSLNRNASWTPPTGMTEAVDASIGTAVTGVSLEVSYALQPFAGASGTKSATANQTQAGQTFTVALTRL